MLVALAFLTSLVPYSEGNILPVGETNEKSHFLLVFTNIVAFILQKFPECEYLIYLQDPQEFSGQSDVRFLYDLHPNATQNPTLVPPYIYKHNQPCSVVLFDQQQESILDLMAIDNSSMVENRWPLRMLKILPCSVHKSFFIFLSNQNQQVLQLNQLLQFIAPIQHAVFIISERSKGVIQIYKGVSQSGYPLEKIATSTIREGVKQNPEVAIFSRDFVNFKGATITYMRCMACKQEFEEYLQKGEAADGLGYCWHTLVQKYNGTLEFEQVFEFPGQGVKLEKNENDQEYLAFDQLMLPVAEGFAAITAPLINAQHVHKVAWLTRPLVYDSIFFITGRPQLKQLHSLSILRQPLDNKVWLGFLLSFIACTLFFCFAKRGNKDKGDFIMAVGTLFRPVVNQSSTFELESGTPKAVFGLWLLFMLTLGCGYNSKIIESIVIPRYTSLPRTYKQLADSDYDIGIIFSHAIKADLMHLNTTASLRIAEKGQELDFLNSMTYQMPLKGLYACIGPWVAFEKFGIPFMVDVDGKILSVKSEEGILTSYAEAAVSRSYPMIIEPLDRLLGLVDQSGIHNYARKFNLPAIVKKGRRWAKENAHVMKFYARESVSATDDAKVVEMVLRILQFGFSVAALAFCTEILSKLLKKVKAVVKIQFCTRKLDIDVEPGCEANVTCDNEVGQNNAEDPSSVVE